MKMATATNEIKEELKEHKMADVVNFNINIPADQKEIIAAFRELIVTFKDKIEVEKMDTQETKKNENVNMSNILYFAGIGKPSINIPDDVNIKEMKLKDKEYMARRYGARF
ncbi:MAG: hypothetical protein RBS42_08055 [Campylobacterales bacterium]|nr:hypothetical protein [Campylobacterales bacterium]